MIQARYDTGFLGSQYAKEEKMLFCLCRKRKVKSAIHNFNQSHVCHSSRRNVYLEKYIHARVS